MAREKVDYRDNYAMLREMFPTRITLTMQEVCTLLHCDRRSLLRDRAFPAIKVGGRYEVSLSSLAKYLRTTKKDQSNLGKLEIIEKQE